MGRRWISTSNYRQNRKAAGPHPITQSNCTPHNYMYQSKTHTAIKRTFLIPQCTTYSIYPCQKQNQKQKQKTNQIPLKQKTLSNPRKTSQKKKKRKKIYTLLLLLTSFSAAAALVYTSSSPSLSPFLPFFPLTFAPSDPALWLVGILGCTPG